jgi:hypothetical protein
MIWSSEMELMWGEEGVVVVYFKETSWNLPREIQENKNKL